jgi:hypothetical protein
VPVNDPALLFPAGKDFTSLIQVSTDNADTFIHELQVFGEIFLPEHRFHVEAARQLMPNLTEQPFQEGGGSKVIRVRIESSFCVNTFFTIMGEESKIIEESLRLIEQYANEFKLISSRPVHFKVIAAFPGILPEHGIHSIKDAILQMGSVRESPSQIAMDWTNETNMEHITDSNFAMLYTESVSSLSRIVTESPISLPFGQVHEINVNEVDTIFHQEAIHKHSKRMQFQQVLLVQGAPTWSDVDTTAIHPPTTPGEEDHSDLTSFFKKYQANGTIGDYNTALFKDVLTYDDPVLTFS